MKSTATLAFGLLILAAATLQQDNFCKHGFCSKCGYGTDLKTRSCSQCGKGVQTLVLGNTALAAECQDTASLPNCKRAYSNINGSGLFCGECNPDFVSTDSGKSCVAVTTKIENCFGYSTLTTCGMCKSGYFKDLTSTTCTKVAVEIKDCDFYTSLGLQCGICKKGFRPSVDSLTCVAESANIGCDSITGKCECRFFHWAVDHLGDALGDKCEYASRVLGFVSVIAVALFSVFSH